MLRRLLILACVVLAVCAFLDGWSTYQFLHRTANSEGDPLFGAHPSDLRLWLEGSAIIAAEMALAWWASSKREWLGWGFAAAFLAQATVHVLFYLDNARSYEHIHHFWR